MTPEEKAKAEALEDLDRLLRWSVHDLNEPVDRHLFLTRLKKIRAALEAKGAEARKTYHVRELSEDDLRAVENAKMPEGFEHLNAEMESIPAPVGEPIEGLQEALAIEDLDTPEWEDAQRPFELKYGKTTAEVFIEAARRYAAGQKPVDVEALTWEIVSAAMRVANSDTLSAGVGIGIEFAVNHLIAQGHLKTNGGD